MVETPNFKMSRKFPWLATISGLITIAALVALPILTKNIADTDIPDSVRFIGRFHPLLLHLPIGIFMLILFQEIGAIFFQRDRENATQSLFPLWFGAASSVVAAIVGFLLYHSDRSEYAGNDLAERHLWVGLAFSVAAVFTYMIKAWTVALSANPAWYRLLFFTSIGMMGFASHDGASITHGSDFLTRYAPNPIRQFLGLKSSKSTQILAQTTAEPMVYENIVAPILERRCVSCHNPEKTKGKLRMDTYDLLLAGGKSGPAIVPGDAGKSEIVIRMELPEDDDEHMPPEGKADIEDGELQVVKWWIDQGALTNKNLNESNPPAHVIEFIAKLQSVEVPQKKAPSAPDSNLKKSVADLSKIFPGTLVFESQNSSLVSFTAVSLRSKLDDESFAQFTAVIPQLVTADLSGSNITDKSVANLEVAKQLRQIRLGETQVTDAAIDSLLKLPALESINLFGTKITDIGLLKLAAIPNLKNLYLWQTAVTPEAIKSLKEKLPNCEIITGT